MSQSTFAMDTRFPASLDASPLLGMLTTMSFWVVVLICLQWLYEIISLNRERPAPDGTYVRVARQVRFWLVMTVLSAAAPRLAQLMLWQVLAPDERHVLSAIAWTIRVPSSVALVWAYWASKRLVATETEFVEHNGYIMTPATSLSEKKRGITILLLIFVVAWSTTYVRRTSDVPRQCPVAECR